MNLPTPSQRFNKKESGLDTAVETVATVSMQFSAKEAKDVSGHSDIPVAIDGTWQKHGHTSLNGAVIVTSFYTGKVLDALILSRFCKCPNKMHNENCKANHFGNSGSMEVSGAIEIFQRSESLHGLRCTKFLGDGDARAYKTVNEMQPYEDIGIEKLECIGYVEKWMGTRLRALKLKMKGTSLSKAVRRLFEIDFVTLNLGLETRMTFYLTFRSPNFHTKSTRGLRASTDLERVSYPLHGRSLVAPGFEPTIRDRDYTRSICRGSESSLWRSAGGRGSLVVKVSDSGWPCHEFEPSTTKASPCTLNLSRAQTSSHWCGVVFRRGVPAQVSSTSLDHDSKERAPSPKALVQLNSATLIFTHSLDAALKYGERRANSLKMNRSVAKSYFEVGR
ncbi:uncharacterized protein TNCV_4395931 [Trichonephila clavipes]|uniref:Mutator-like transposase domain-containing protein n=1 Tax=Trichonephila clavipes TaxID=2585209 RepID=A0A8X6W5C5_TRICX|nr:uncharacterized protein TNCV_4395931 [Trichonephila clavipes]